MKERLSIYLDPHVMRSLIDYTDRRGKSKSLIAEAAIASFLSPDAAERQEATLARRLDRLVRQTERLERDVGIAVETLATDSFHKIEACVHGALGVIFVAFGIPKRRKNFVPDKIDNSSTPMRDD
jgi:hypothetical protein